MSLFGLFGKKQELPSPVCSQTRQKPSEGMYCIIPLKKLPTVRFIKERNIVWIS